ncbi:adenylate kinase family enzyme [Clostridium punense]|uniref:Adenylate kinase n=1 Tax=Clostridium punense TaxID=1054297 RepID=A0ABS4K8T0_9CLOT|nr:MULTISPECIES: nucleoside monophosphate kinase [Clostridium]EQB87681.1 hypothetical protein M918_07885 [Clostridium sp. BL8]MBP2024185.1 adenylate kinase family enzyme [Clostridium punense]
MKRNLNIIIDKVRVQGDGAILLIGPSGCGKGEIAKSLCNFLSIPQERHLSMGDILRRTITKANKNEEFKCTLGERYKISSNVSIFDKGKNTPEVIKKAESYFNDIVLFLGLHSNTISQFHWLEFCVGNGLLIPDHWAASIISSLFESTPELCKGLFILDGYPRTEVAAEKLLNTFQNLNISIIKVLHLFITKEQMKARAYNRRRIDDTEDSLERRYEFYVDKVQPCADYLKRHLGRTMVSLVDAHQPVYNEDGSLKVEESIEKVVNNVLEELGIPAFLMNLSHCT